MTTWESVIGVGVTVERRPDMDVRMDPREASSARAERNGGRDPWSCSECGGVPDVPGTADPECWMCGGGTP